MQERNKLYLTAEIGPDPLYGGDLATNRLTPDTTIGWDNDGVRLLKNIGKTPEGDSVTVFRRDLGDGWIDREAVQVGDILVGVGNKRTEFIASRYKNGEKADSITEWSKLTINERKTMRRALRHVRRNKPQTGK